MKTTLDIIQLVGIGVNLVIDANTKTTLDLIQIVGSVGLKDSHITITNAHSKTTKGRQIITAIEYIKAYCK
jgi:hypothetical protein